MWSPWLVLLSFFSNSASPQSRPAVVADTIDVTVGSPVLDGRKMTAFTTHLLVHRVVNDQETLAQEARNSIAFVDSGGRSFTRVQSIGTAKGPNGPVNTNMTYTFDRATLALVSMVVTAPSERRVSVSGQDVSLAMSTPNGPINQSMRLSQPGYFAPWSDYVVEELPKKLGAVYRVRLWQPGGGRGGPPSVDETTHLYTFTRREAITVLGKHYPDAWVVEDRVAGDSRLAGTMWIVDGPPKLVRWTINDATGVTRIDQELVSASK